MDAVGSAQVESARRLRGDDQPGRESTGQLARGHELLLVASRERRDARQRIARPHVEGADQLLRFGTAAFHVDKRTARMRRLVLTSERDILLHRHR